VHRLDTLASQGANHLIQKILIAVVLLIVASFLYQKGTDNDFTDKRPAVREIAATKQFEAELPESKEDEIVETDELAMSELDRKRAQMKKNALNTTGLTDAEMDGELRFAKDIMSGGESTERVLSDWYSDNLDAHGADEANFRLGLALHASSWEEQKKLVAERESALGATGSGIYDQLLLDLGVSHGQIPFEEIKALYDRGAMIPEDIAYTLAANGRSDLIVQLSQSRLLANPNYEQPAIGKNAIGALIEHATYFPADYQSPQDARKAIGALIAAGVVPVSVNGGIDPLDDALAHISAQNFEIKYAIAQRLLEHGVPIEQSHRELVSMLPAGAQRQKLEELLGGQ